MNRILFVDDEPRVLSGLRRMLRSRHGEWHMEFVESAAAALQAMEAEPVDVIVTDFRMPGINGGHLLSEVRRRYPDTARLILSGHTEEKDLTTVVSLAHQFLSKPCQSDELQAALERALRLRRELDGERIRAEVSEIGVLPSPPSALHDLVVVLESPDCDTRAIVRVLERDVALATKVLQVVNSSFFAPRARVTSLEAAVVRLGIYTIRSLILIEEIVKAVEIRDGLARDWLEQLNRHSLEVARLARRLAEPDSRDDAFCAGLLHECGHLVFASCRPELFIAHLRLRELDGRSLIEMEREAFGVTHAQSGAYLLSLWGFPLEVVEAAAVHANPDLPSTSEPQTLAGIVQVAHLLVSSEDSNPCGAPEGPALDDHWLEEAGLLAEVWNWRAEKALQGAA
jgi:HD-like signal output (HDOD) protein/CheY-like chemotaxis protein